MRKFAKTSLTFVAALMLGSMGASVMAAQVQGVSALDEVQSARTLLPLAEDLLSRNKPRVPGGSGCDDPQDQIEHPECRSAAIQQQDLLARSTPRVPGGSGCDDPQDVAEHPECRP